MMGDWFSVGEEEDWIPGAIGEDVLRHQQKVQEAIRNNLADMVSEERIGLSDGSRVVSVPLPSLKEYRICYDHNRGESVGHLGSKNGEKGTENAASGGKLGGQEPGSDIEETSVSLEEVQRVIFQDLRLPDLDPNRRADGTGMTAIKPETLSLTGPKNQWQRRATMYAHLRRQARLGNLGPGRLAPEDLRFWRYQDEPDAQGGAVVLAMMDTSGSMGSFEKYLAKSFFYWTVEFLRQNYPRGVELVFLAHDVRAREVDEETFFHRGASGGTVSSSVYRLALDIVQERYDLSQYNVYAFHFTDGGNLTSDNGQAEALGLELKEHANFFGYGEIHDTERSPSPLYQAFSDKGVDVIVLHDKQDIFHALYQFFGPRPGGIHANA
ncbi:MAG: DUF444 domain-containing protein [Sulfobacillus benefaciens]|uniref:DUF444 domain-containing protein n=1 Tax=Sulfobacillus benefaciens TaxID=453960 RepID=A0A2T2XG15_9FIRM|nr:MAG: DUF444 domain-containing protein [Sulfobacillus benefaciens]